MRRQTQTLILIAGGVFVGWWVLNRGRAVAQKINPVSRENIAYQAAGEPGLKIADWFGGLFKSEAERRVDRMLTATDPGHDTTTRSIMTSWEMY